MLSSNTARRKIKPPHLVELAQRGGIDGEGVRSPQNTEIRARGAPGDAGDAQQHLLPAAEEFDLVVQAGQEGHGGREHNAERVNTGGERR